MSACLPAPPPPPRAGPQFVNNARGAQFTDADLDLFASLAARVGDVVSEMLLQQRVCGALPGGPGGNAFEVKRTGARSVRSRTAWTVAQSDFGGASYYDDDDGGSGDDKGRRDDMVSMKSGYGACVAWGRAAFVRLVLVCVAC
jgi:hypothetical protein